MDKEIATRYNGDGLLLRFHVTLSFEEGRLESESVYSYINGYETRVKSNFVFKDEVQISNLMEEVKYLFNKALDNGV